MSAPSAGGSAAPSGASGSAAPSGASGSGAPSGASGSAAPSGASGSGGQAITRAGIEARFRDEGLSPTGWGNGPDERYGWHSHGNHKVLYCVSGSIVFHTRTGDVALEAGDRLDLPPGTEHAATVGPSGCQCMEAYR